MGRWTQYDEDDYRLPEGMKRVGYDADTQKYTFRDQDGVYWEGPEGAEYGELRKVGQESRSSADLEATAPSREDGYASVPELVGGRTLRDRNRDAWRQLLPFFLIIAVFLLLVFRLSPSFIKPRQISCPEHSRPMVVKSGDTCWDIAQEYGTSLENLRSINPHINCSTLKPGQRMCVPMDD
ncbi:LysM-domain-containing protein [Fomitiporia mediterranea MF3/22]|uniref:LysM-domain-containing protein n=1 Tax=Fomitiporia mediterranea (strain MF3/22) TaxID=694068 RepID=UPI00044088F9|nr:LysM-domain-containing protein [Fomitiporia mediterranea MF3/22]EJD03795.1 LysM-domain-containing protein [Fomitiporia mediterranea MF3/22]